MAEEDLLLEDDLSEEEEGVALPPNNFEGALDPALPLDMPTFCETFEFRERFSNDGEQVVQRTFLTPWSTRYLFKTGMLGYSNVVVKSDGGTGLTRQPPLQDADYPWLYAAEVDLVRGEGFADEQAVFIAGKKGARKTLAFLENKGTSSGPGGIETGDGMARYRVTFLPRADAVLSDAELKAGNLEERHRYLEIRETYNIRGISIPPDTKTTLKFTDEAPTGIKGATVPLEGAVIPVPGRQIRLIWRNLPVRPYNNDREPIDDCIGKVNDKTLSFTNLGPHFSYPAGTLLCQAPLFKRVPRGVTGKTEWEVEYVFDLNARGWDRFLAKDGNYYKATLGGGANDATLFKTADFDTLFYFKFHTIATV